MTKINPFTRTPGVAGVAFIDMHYAEQIIENFESPLSSQYVYKIVGIRGSGKSVHYSKVIRAFAKKEGWLTYTLSAAGDPVSTLIAKLSKEPFIDGNRRSTSIQTSGSAEATIGIAKGSANLTVTKTAERNALYYSAEAELTDMIQTANDNGYKILVGIDDIAKTPEMVRFLSIWGTLLLDEQKQVYFVCTGLSKNIEDFSDAPNLTFFKRSESIETGPLDKYAIAQMYRQLLGVDEQEAAKLSKFTHGYAYAYQVLGSLFFDRQEDDTWDDIVAKFDRILFADSYDLIWKSLTDAEQDFVRCVFRSNSGKAADIKSAMNHPKSYDSLRQRIRNKHLIDTDDRGYIRINLPRFREYVQLWHEQDL